MALKSVFLPFASLSFNSGKLNSQGLVQADGVIQNGAGYLSCPPLFAASAAISGVDEADGAPAIAHVNVNSSNNSTFTIYLYSGGKLWGADISGDPPWTFVDMGTLAALSEDEGAFVSMGPHTIFAAGHGNHVQIRRDGQPGFEACFISADKPKAKYVAGIGQRLLFANIANTGSAGTPDPRHSLAWWGYTNDARRIGNDLSLPEGNTNFNPLDDNFGDIRGLANGRRDSTIFKDRAVHQMLLGGEFGFEFQCIDTSHGLKYPRSVVELNEDDYFWSRQGPAVVRGGRVQLLGDGFWTERALGIEGPAVFGLEVLDAAADPDNELVFWLIRYNGFTYTYSEDATTHLPSEAINETRVVYALLAYNPVSNQFSFVWRQVSRTQTATEYPGVKMIDESSPSTDHQYIPLCLVDRIPWRNQLPMSGVGIFMVESAMTGSNPRNAKLFLCGLSSTDYTPDWLIDQDVIFTTGLIPIRNPEKLTLRGVRLVARSRRGFDLPGVSVRIRVVQDPFSVERVHGPFTSAANMDARDKIIRTNGVQAFTMVAVELTIDKRTAGSPVKYAFLLNEIEGVELMLGDGR